MAIDGPNIAKGDEYPGESNWFTVDTVVATNKPAITIKAKKIIPTIARNLAHLDASFKCAFVAGSIDKEKSEVFETCP